MECNQIGWYIKKLLKMKVTVNKHQRKIQPSDIGIVSPYKKQCSKIREMCKREKLGDFEIGSVEIFQGREKPIIITSTVRSNQKTIGFLGDYRVNIYYHIKFLSSVK